MIDKDFKLEQMYIRKNISKSRKIQYRRVFKRIYDLTGYTPTILLEIARDEQKPKLINNQIEYKELEDRTITKIQYQLYSHLNNDLQLKPATIKSELSIYRAFLNEYDIQLPKNINIRLNQPLYEDGDLPKKEHILQAVNSTNNKRNKALFYFMSSSGIRPIDVRNFKIKDWIKSCDYYSEKENPTLNDLLEMDYTNWIPCFYFKPQKTSNFNNICCTFCSTEATVSIMDYLKSRHIKSDEEYLFSSRGTGNQLAQTSFITLFQRLNDKEFGINKYGDRFFQPKYLRKYFITTCNRHSGDLLKVRLLAGHSLTDIDRAYNEISIPVMRRFYISLLPYLSLNDTSVKTVKSKEYLDLERKLQKQEEENRKLQDELDERINSAIFNVLERYK